MSAISVKPRLSEWEPSDDLPLPLSEVIEFYNLRNISSPPPCEKGQRPYVWTNTITTLDGVIHMLGDTDVSDIGLQGIPGFESLSACDFRLLNTSWMFSDAILITGENLRSEPNVTCRIIHEDLKKFRQDCILGNHESFCFEGEEGSNARDSENEYQRVNAMRRQHPIRIVLTASGDIPCIHPFFHIEQNTDEETLDSIWIVTTSSGEELFRLNWTSAYGSLENMPKVIIAEAAHPSRSSTSMTEISSTSSSRLSASSVSSSLDEKMTRSLGAKKSCTTLSLPLVLHRLWREGIRFLDISAGGSLIRQCIQEQLVDEIRMTVSNQIVGTRVPDAQVGKARFRPTLFHDHLGQDRSVLCYSKENSPLLSWKGIRLLGEFMVFYRGVYVYR